MTKTCPSRELLVQFTAGQLEELSTQEIATHIDGCAECQTALEEVSGLAAASGSPERLIAALRQSVALPFGDEPALAEALPQVVELGGSASSFGDEPTIAPAGHAPAVLPASAPKQIRDYEILEKLGEGGMGAVYKARHMRLKKIVALKVLPRDRELKPEVIARFEREMEAVGKLEHPHLVRAMDAGEFDGTHFLVMEYVDGVDLSQLVKLQGPLSLADACELIRQAAVGLQHIHEQGLVHRDIKPSNLMLAPSGAIKILDLGLALLGGDGSSGRELTTTGQMMGTLDYMAPEQGGDTHRVDIRADIYSLGSTLYKLLAGVAPFGDPKFDTPVKKLMALAVQDPLPIEERRSDVPADLAAVIQRMLAKEPDERYATPAELERALAPFTAGNQVAVLATSTAGVARLPIADGNTHPSLKSASVETHTHLRKATAKTIPPAILFKSSSFRRWLIAALVLISCGGAAAAFGIILYWETPAGTVRIEILDPNVSAKFDKGGLVITGADKEPIEIQATPAKPAKGKAVPSGDHTLTITRGKFTFRTTNFQLDAKGETVLKIELLGDTDIKVSKNNSPLKHQVVPGEPPVVAATPPAGKNLALEFDGTTSHVKLPLTFDGTHPLTIEVTIWPLEPLQTGTWGKYGAILANRSNPGGISLGLDHVYNLRMDSERPGGGTVTSWQENRDPSWGLPIRVAAVWNGQEGALFRNGVVVKGGFNQNKLAPSPLPFVLGARYYGADKQLENFFRGRLDELRISKCARTDEELATHADLHQRLAVDDNTLALYHCDEGSGTRLIDASPSQRHGEIANVKWTAPESPPQTQFLELDGELITFPKLPWTPDQPKTVEVIVASYKTATNSMIFTWRTEGTWLEIGHGHDLNVGSDNNWLLAWSRPERKVVYYTPTNSLVARELVHIAAVQTSANDMKLFFNGQLQSRRNIVGGDPRVPLVQMGRKFSGRLHELRLSNGARYDKSFTPPPLDRPLDLDAQTLALYHFDESQNEILFDTSGNKHHGQISGGTWLKNDGSPVRDLTLPAANNCLLVGEQRWVDWGYGVSHFGGPVVKTIELQVIVDENLPADTKIFNYHDATGLVVQGGKLACYWYDATFQQSWVESLEKLTPRQEYHVALVAEPLDDGVQLTMFVDGKKQNTAKVPHNRLHDQPRSPLFVGSPDAAAEKRSRVAVDEIRMSSSVRYKADFTPERRHRWDLDTVYLYHCDDRGTVLWDAAPGYYNGAIHNGILDQVPRALEFDGQKSHVVLPDLGIAADKPVTLELWLEEPAEVPADIAVLLETTGPVGFGIFRHGNKLGFTRHQEGRFLNQLFELPPEGGQRIHVAGVWDGERARIFVDGKPGDGVTEGAFDHWKEPGGTIGVQRQADGVLSKYFRGVIDEVRISQSARYLEEFVPDKRLKADEATLALYHCGEELGTGLTDSSKHLHHGKVVATKWVRTTVPSMPAP